jgi:hypothetical protein
MTPHGVDAARNRPQEDTTHNTTTRPTQEPRTTKNTSTTTKTNDNNTTTNTNNQGTNHKNKDTKQPQSTNRAGIPMPSGGRVCRGGTGHAA